MRKEQLVAMLMAVIVGGQAFVIAAEPQAGEANPTPLPVLKSDELRVVDAAISDSHARLTLALAKLDPQSLERKRELGRLRGLLIACDDQITSLARRCAQQEGQVERLQAEYAELGLNEGGLETEQAQKSLAALRANHRSLIERRASLEARYEELRKAHLRSIYSALKGPEERTVRSPIEQLLDELPSEPSQSEIPGTSPPAEEAP